MTWYNFIRSFLYLYLCLILYFLITFLGRVSSLYNIYSSVWHCNYTHFRLHRNSLAPVTACAQSLWPVLGLVKVVTVVVELVVVALVIVLVVAALVVVATFLLNAIGCLNKLFNKHVIYAVRWSKSALGSVRLLGPRAKAGHAHKERVSESSFCNFSY